MRCLDICDAVACSAEFFSADKIHLCFALLYSSLVRGKLEEEKHNKFKQVGHKYREQQVEALEEELKKSVEGSNCYYVQFRLFISDIFPHFQIHRFMDCLKWILPYHSLDFPCDCPDFESTDEPIMLHKVVEFLTPR